MFVLARAVTYATLFIGLVLVFVPSRVLSWSGVNPPAHIGIWQVAGMVAGTAGAWVALWCILTLPRSRCSPGSVSPAPALSLRVPSSWLGSPCNWPSSAMFHGCSRRQLSEDYWSSRWRGYFGRVRMRGRLLRLPHGRQSWRAMKHACGSGGRVTFVLTRRLGGHLGGSMLPGMRGTRCRRTPRLMSEYGGISLMLPRAHVERFRKRRSRNSERGGSHHQC